jgi:nucleoside-diphosphate-sugar epimerase
VCDILDKVAITGPTGMIGLALINLLLKKDIEIFVISRQKSDRIVNIPKSDKINVIKSDLSKLYSISSKIPNDCDTFFHLGWTGTLRNKRNDPFVQELNIQYTLDAVKLANDLGCETFVGAGSQAEYGIVNQKLFDNTPINPIMAYGIAKYAAGKLSKYLCDDLKIKHVWGRVLSVYGPGDNNHTLIMSCIKSLLNSEKFSTTEGKQLWDYMYSEDCANALLSMAEKGKHGNTYCICSGEVKYIRDYIEIIKSNFPSSLPIGYGDLKYPNNQIMYLHGDISKLYKHSGFKPKISFENGIKKTINWFKKNNNWCEGKNSNKL